ncbi:MAG: hypothetical protein C0507_06365 [Cyanobacteria bacterium PR.3.49]|nr:hypothetical protein [Cyanobacteria bacterium PR.3.49]
MLEADSAGSSDMFAYLIIAAELLVLYTVFWYIFLREPRPYRIKGEMWGRYDNNALARYFESLEHELRQESNASAAYSHSEYEWLTSLDGSHMNRLQTLAISKPICPQAGGAAGYPTQNAKKYGWTVEDPNRLDGNPFKFAVLMAEKLGNLSSRRP